MEGSFSAEHGIGRRETRLERYQTLDLELMRTMKSALGPSDFNPGGTGSGRWLRASTGKSTRSRICSSIDTRPCSSWHRLRELPRNREPAAVRGLQRF